MAVSRGRASSRSGPGRASAKEGHRGGSEHDARAGPSRGQSRGRSGIGHVTGADVPKARVLLRPFVVRLAKWWVPSPVGGLGLGTRAARGLGPGVGPPLSSADVSGGIYAQWFKLPLFLWRAGVVVVASLPREAGALSVNHKADSPVSRARVPLAVACAQPVGSLFVGQTGTAKNMLPCGAS